MMLVTFEGQELDLEKCVIRMKMKMGKETSLSSLDMVTTKSEAPSFILNSNLFFPLSTSR